MTRLGVSLCFGLLSVALFPESFARGEEKSVLPTQTVSAMSPMPAIRRVGILPARSNVVEFREFMRNETRNTSGFLSLPYTEDQVSRELSRMALRGVSDSGRFWSLSLDALVELSGVSPQGARDYTAAELRLYKTYDLDGWIEPEVLFSPDHTKLRLTLRSARDRSLVLAREDIVFEAFPTSGEIEKNVHNALVRVAATLAHDGRVTWRKNDLVVVDFGKERGLAHGSLLAAGYVILSARHPVSQEYLRSQKIQTLELEVIEAREGSSVCRIVRRHPLMETEANNLVPGLTEKGLLAWRKSNPAESGWLEFSPSKTADVGIVSGAEAGFRSEEKSQITPPAQTPAALVQPAVPGEKSSEERPSKAATVPEQASTPAPLSNDGEKSDSAQAAQNNSADAEEEQDDSGKENRSSSLVDELEGLFDFGKWKPREGMVGLGLAGGQLDSTSGTLKTEFPATILNSIRGSVLLRYSKQIYVEPDAYFHSFSGLVDGYRAEFALPLSYVTWGDFEKPGIGALAFGLGPTVLLGEVSSVRTIAGRVRKTTQSFSAVAVAIHGIYSLDVPVVGVLRAKASVPIAEVLQGEGTALDLRAQVHPYRYVPKELGFYAGMRMGPGIWTGYDFGASWTLKL
jgi:hypothetical protein